MTLWVGIRVEAALVLTPWWRIVSYWRAARAGVDMSRNQRDQARAEARTAVERVYREAQVAEATEVLLHGARHRLIRELARVELLLDEDLPGASEQDRLRLTVDLSGLDARLIEARRNRERALARIRGLTGLPPQVRADLERLTPTVAPLQPLEWYLEAARRQRPEIQLSLAAHRATEALVAVRQSDLVPDLAIGGYYDFNSTPGVDDQHSQFGRDLWNGVGLGYGLVWRWELGIGERVARLREARADVDQAQAMRRYALGGVAYEVEGAYLQSVEDTQSFEARSRAREVAQAWLERVREEFEHGQTTGETLSDALDRWMTQELAYLRALARLHQGRAELERAAGLEAFATRSRTVSGEYPTLRV